MRAKSIPLAILLQVLLFCGVVAANDTWVVIVGASRYWFNYRHVTNAYAIYRMVREQGVPDSHIIMMNSYEIASNERNPFKEQVFPFSDKLTDLVAPEVETDYSGSDVTVANFLRLLTGRYSADTPISKQLRSTSSSKVLLYLAGHGGDGFLKFQDKEELNSAELADGLAEMEAKGRYQELLVFVETCEAATLGKDIRSSAISFIGTSLLDEKSYGADTDRMMSTSLLDIPTQTLLQEYLGSPATPQDSNGRVVRRRTGGVPPVLVADVDTQLSLSREAAVRAAGPSHPMVFPSHLLLQLRNASNAAIDARGQGTGRGIPQHDYRREGRSAIRSSEWTAPVFRGGQYADIIATHIVRKAGDSDGDRSGVLKPTPYQKSLRRRFRKTFNKVLSQMTFSRLHAHLGLAAFQWTDPPLLQRPLVEFIGNTESYRVYGGGEAVVADTKAWDDIPTAAHEELKAARARLMARLAGKTRSVAGAGAWLGRVRKVWSGFQAVVVKVYHSLSRVLAEVEW